MTTSLQELLDGQEPELAQAVAEAEAELESLRQQCSDLELLIERGKAALGVVEEDDEPGVGSLKLHEAMEVVILDRDNVWMSAAKICEAINERGLYRMRDGRAVEAGQVHARVRNYEHQFERQDGQIRLRYRFDTQRLDKSGAYSLAMSTVTRSSDSARMYVAVKVAYSVTPPPGDTLEEYAVRAADERARHHIKDQGFQSDRELRWMLTTHGWQLENRD